MGISQQAWGVVNGNVVLQYLSDLLVLSTSCDKSIHNIQNNHNQNENIVLAFSCLLISVTPLSSDHIFWAGGAGGKH